MDVDPVFDVSADDGVCVTAEGVLCHNSAARIYEGMMCRGFALYEGVSRCLVLWFWFVCLRTPKHGWQTWDLSVSQPQPRHPQ
jgi:hypothetical protein